METIYMLYITTNLVNGKTYIGIHKTNNLDDGYLGSGSAIVEAVEKYGKENFKREVLEFCNSYDELLELEKLYVNSDWVRDKSNYNLKTGGQSSGILSDESKKKISDTLKEKYKNGELDRREGIVPYNITDEIKEKISKTLKERYREQEHNRKGIDPWNKGLKGVQVGWNKGLKLEPMTEEEKEKRSKTLKERWKNQVHHSKGVDPWNKGLKGVQEAWNKGIQMEKIECPYCGKMSDKANAKRWHFDNCKKKNV